METKAYPAPGITVLLKGILPDGGRYLEVPCADYDAYKALPPCVTCEGERYGLTGWNSDWGLAYYKGGARVALPA